MSREGGPRHGAERWFILALGTLALLYVAFSAGSLFMGGPFYHTGLDYRSFYCSAKIAWNNGFAQVYDLEAQGACQRALCAAYARDPTADCVTIPTPYLPPFLLPFIALLPLGPAGGLIAWTLLNAAALLLYLRRFGRAIGHPAFPWAVVLSFSAFFTLLLGQANVVLLICMGEFILSCTQGRDLRGGLWLGGLLLKPQFLVLLAPGLLIGRRFRALAGLALSGAATLALTLLLGGWSGTAAVVRLLLLYPGNLATTAPEAMMNWRALAIHLERLLPPAFSWGIAAAGMVACAVMALWLWGGQRATSTRGLIGAALGAAAASCAVAWHAHAHAALFLAPLLLLAQEQAGLPRPALSLWAAAPGLLYFSLLLVSPALASALSSMTLLGIHLYLLVWAMRAVPRPFPQGAI